MLDIDNFRSINDNYGHSIGDRVIMATTNKCTQSIRGDDYFARYGGEEFAIILPGASLKNATKKVKVICEAVVSASYFLDDLPGNPTLSVTVSIGVSTYHKADKVFSVIKRADSALYNAKRNGKNCVSSEKDLQ
jgi:diguanylate cyclase